MLSFMSSQLSAVAVYLLLSGNIIGNALAMPAANTTEVEADPKPHKYGPMCKDLKDGEHNKRGYICAIGPPDGDFGGPTPIDCHVIMNGLKSDTEPYDFPRCYRHEGGEASCDEGKRVACPGDKPPSAKNFPKKGKQPNAEQQKKLIAKDTVDAFCGAAGDEGLFGFVTQAACYAFTFAFADSEIDAANEFCDAVFFGLCSCMTKGQCYPSGDP